MSKAEHFTAVLDALDIGLDGLSDKFKEVHNERPPMFEEMPPDNVRSIVVIDGHVYAVTIEAVDG